VYLFLVSALEHRGRGARFGIDLQTVRVASAGGTVFEKATRVAFQETFLFYQHGTESAVVNEISDHDHDASSFSESAVFPKEATRLFVSPEARRARWRMYDVGFIDYAIESRTRNFVVGKGGGGDLGVVLVGMCCSKVVCSKRRKEVKAMRCVGLG